MLVITLVINVSYYFNYAYVYLLTGIVFMDLKPLDKEQTGVLAVINKMTPYPK